MHHAIPIPIPIHSQDTLEMRGYPSPPPKVSLGRGGFRQNKL